MSSARSLKDGSVYVFDEVPPEREICPICDQPLLAGQMVLNDVTEGLGHRACFGEDRSGYVKNLDTGDPLGPDDPIPTGFPYAHPLTPKDTET